MSAPVRIGAQHIAKHLKNAKGHDQILRKVTVVHLKDGYCHAEMNVSEEHTNSLGTLHGGLSATLVDNVSSWALMSHAGGEYPSVSVEMNMTYLKGAKIGEDIKIEANTLKVGKTLAFLEVFIKNKSSGDLLVKGAHTKFLLR
ncbi:acyl-coenzyme A thioesterase 13 [Leptinotarsa decemlineata]|uniref:acyl-coenzyme A thioesterase 13 n=1 Tax=Leptinotarsa decemlineata TaxID=7539 RepID=UPI000C2553FB|nr:acyl-coenzyme A thioesterase 13-like [Leptinotarsa decemlineata]XP_023019558.1 acyl-coenzyme A thioesterase 13-like [Leptinotarsa decemlineata]